MSKTGAARKIFKKRDKSLEEYGEQVALFAIEGDDGEPVEYTVPNKVPPAFALTSMRLIAETGEQSGSYWILKQLLSEGGYDALENADMEQGDLEEIFKDLQKIVFGDIPKGSKK